VSLIFLYLSISNRWRFRRNAFQCTKYNSSHLVALGLNFFCFQATFAGACKLRSSLFVGDSHSLEIILSKSGLSFFALDSPHSCKLFTSGFMLSVVIRIGMLVLFERPVKSLYLVP
jgi:hypothetical protein